MEYSVTGYRINDLVRLDVKINNEAVDPLATIVHRDQAYPVCTVDLMTVVVECVVCWWRWVVGIAGASHQRWWRAMSWRSLAS